MFIEKKKGTRGKPLLDSLTDEDSKTLFASPSKIQSARELTKAKEDNKPQSEQQKRIDKEAK